MFSEHSNTTKKWIIKWSIQVNPDLNQQLPSEQLAFNTPCSPIPELTFLYIISATVLSHFTSLGSNWTQGAIGYMVYYYTKYFLGQPSANTDAKPLTFSLTIINTNPFTLSNHPDHWVLGHHQYKKPFFQPTSSPILVWVLKSQHKWPNLSHLLPRSSVLVTNTRPSLFISELYNHFKPFLKTNQVMFYWQHFVY